MSIGALGVGSYASWYQPAEPLPAPQGSSTAPSSADTSAAPSARPSSATLASQDANDAGDLSRSSSLSASIKTSDSDSPPPGVEPSSEQTDSTMRPGEVASLGGASSSSGETSRQSLVPPAVQTGPGGGGETTPTGIGAEQREAPFGSSSQQQLQHLESGAESMSDRAAAASLGVSDRFWPLSTATMQTSVFDVVHVFSERGISAVPIVDEDGVVLNLFETVDIVVSGAEAFEARPCTPD